jgi:hypothetical protein
MRRKTMNGEYLIPHRKENGGGVLKIKHELLQLFFVGRWTFISRQKLFY